MTSSEIPSTSRTRRKFLGLGGAGAIGGIACYLGWPDAPATISQAEKAAALGTPSAPISTTEVATTDGFGRNLFLPHLGSEFQLSGSATICRLLEVSDDFRSTSPSAEFVSFSLLFSAPAGSAVESAIHTITHPTLGTLELFLSPIGKPDQGLHLEAVCSRRV